MALSDFYSNLQVLVRWLHELVGIMWIGSIYFFDFVIVPAQRAGGDAGNGTVHSTLLRRALWWIRWAGLAAVGFGLILLVVTYFYIPGEGFGPNKMFLDGQVISDRAIWIFFGMTVALVMFFNIWFVMEPAQKKLLLGEATPEDVVFLRRRSFRALRTATFFSGPMLFAMLAPSHYGAISLTSLVAAMAAGFLVIWCAVKISTVI